MRLQDHGRGDPIRRNAAAEHPLTLLGLEDRIDCLTANLSGGQKQRVAVALVANPEVVFADEPHRRAGP
ncbi:MAG: ATP-binding cassette domain-containing protein [Tabrizicola sp.]|nr:ATP-binding cassette domain-containing protein [Tabrizicola sp.]MDP3196099.1 ATP-binding cassette domain-containing protein [Tabrizicola sp.]